MDSRFRGNDDRGSEWRSGPACTSLPAAGTARCTWGVTFDLPGRVHQHRESLIKGFTSRYGVSRFVYYEGFDDMITTITREK